MRLKTLCLAAGLLATSLWQTARADEPFRNHRQDGFKACEVNDSSIVFIGNSITNMGEWWEFFGAHPRVVNRGNSGCYSYESLDQIESILVGRPAKIFVMVGTNDIGGATGDATSIAANARQLIERVRTESPKTEVYITSVFPSTNGLRNTTNLAGVNTALKAVCTETNTTYVDLWDALMGITTGALSLDRLHLNPNGYRIWCEAVSQYTGLTPVFTDNNMTLNAAGQSYSYGMRAQQFGCLPVKKNDILIVGDELVHGGEWHELLHSNRVKGRGTVWGYGGITIPLHKQMLDATLATNPAIKEQPEQIYFYVGLNPLNNDNVSVDSMATDYAAMIAHAKELAPNSKLFICALTPHPTDARNTKTINFNTKLREIADTAGCTYVDTYTPLANAAGTARNDSLIDGNGYATARGYNRLAQVLAPHMGTDVYATSTADFEQHYALINAREALGRHIVTAKSRTVGTTTGTYTAEGMKPLLAKVDEAMALLAKDDVTIEEIEAMTKEIAPLAETAKSALNAPTAGKWYALHTTQRSNLYLTAAKDGTLVGATDVTSTGAQWGFETRTDGTYNIVNRYTGAYLAPGNSPLKATAAVPSAGWSLGAAATTPLYIITSGTVQINQTTSALNQAIYNWGYNTTGFANTYNTSDAGCQYAITELADDALAISPDEVELMPRYTTADTTYWQWFYTPQRESRYVTEVNNALVGETNPSTQASQWKLVGRTDGTYDIINRATGNYILPTAATNSQLTTGTSAPATGWTISAAATDGCYIITSGSAEFNQTTSTYSYKVYNWGSGTNTTDTGCQYAFKVINRVPNVVNGIADITATDTTTSDCYDLQGRHHKRPQTRGLYISRGQKVLVK